MSQITKRRCDYCGFETEDRYSIPGWIQINSGSTTGWFSITVSIARTEDRVAKTAHVRAKELDFCGMECLTTYLNDIKRKRYIDIKDDLRHERDR